MGSLIAFEAGEAITYGLYNAQERGTLFIGPGEKVYSGMVIGQTGRSEDIEINVCKKKQLTNTRSSSADEDLTSRKDVPFAMGVRGFETTIRNEPRYS